MSGAAFVLGLAAWMLVGMVAVEGCRIWRFWWLNPLDPLAMLLWPIILLMAVVKGARP